MADESMNNPLIDEIAELVAYYCSQSRSCMKLAQQYYDENKILVEKKIKLICDGDEKLRLALSITGEHQMNCVLMMATIKAADASMNGRYYVELTDTYLNNQKKERLEPIQDKLLRVVHWAIMEQDCSTEKAVGMVLESRKFTKASQAFFYPLFLRDWIEGEIHPTKEKALHVGVVAVDVIHAISPPEFSIYQGNDDWQSSRIGYIVDKYYFKKTGTSFNKLKQLCVSRSNEFTKRQVASNLVLAATETYLGFHSDIAGSGDVCLTKEIRGKIAFIAYGALLEMYDEEDIDYAFVVSDPIYAFEDKKDLVKNILDDFVSIVVEATHLYGLGYQYRKAILQNIYNYFFNPRGEKQEAALKETRRKLDQQTRENESLKKYCKQYEQEAAQARTELTETKNNLASSKAKIDRLMVELKQANDRCRELENELEKLKADGESATVFDPETEPPSASPEEKPDYFQLLTDIFQNKTVVFIGGNQNIMGKFSKRYPKAIVIPQNRVPFAEQQIVQADALLFKPDSMGHKEYTPVKALAQKNNIPVGYVNNVANVGLMEESVYKALAHLGITTPETASAVE